MQTFLTHDAIMTTLDGIAIVILPSIALAIFRYAIPMFLYIALAEIVFRVKPSRFFLILTRKVFP